MPVRVRIRLRALQGPRAGRTAELDALLSTAYIASSPEVIVPVELAEWLGLWPPPESYEQIEYYAAGEPMVFCAIRQCAMLQAVERDVQTEEIPVDLVVSESEDEVLLSDYVIGELGIIVLDARRGFWRFKRDPASLVRHSRGGESWPRT